MFYTVLQLCVRPDFEALLNDALYTETFNDNVCGLYVEFKLIVHYDTNITFLIALIQLSTCNGVVVVGVCWSNVKMFAFIYIKVHLPF